MILRGVHFLLTYRCDVECDHCFVWGSPKARGVFTLKHIRRILAEVVKLGTVDHVSMEGGEPFLYYPLMVRAVEEAVKLDFHVEILSNCYWASCLEDAIEWLTPLAKAKNVELSLSSDPYHGEKWEIKEVRNAVQAADELGVRVEVLAIKDPRMEAVCPTEIGGAKVGLYDLMYKGRATLQLAKEANQIGWMTFTKCPYEELMEPKRVHVDPFGYVHACQGISIGNAWQTPFSKIIEDYDPRENPILEPLVRGGPVALVEKFGIPHDEGYADACHLCYETRCMLRKKYPHILAPDEMYGVFT